MPISQHNHLLSYWWKVGSRRSYVEDRTSFPPTHAIVPVYLGFSIISTYLFHMIHGMGVYIHRSSLSKGSATTFTQSIPKIHKNMFLVKRKGLYKRCYILAHVTFTKERTNFSTYYCTSKTTNIKNTIIFHLYKTESYLWVNALDIEILLPMPSNNMYCLPGSI